jgi:probable rRNA maturation factor
MADYEIEVQQDVALPLDIADTLTAAATMTLRQQAVSPPASLTILLAGDATLQQLNRDFMGYDMPTDVLSFPAGEIMPGMAEAGMDSYLGDLAISVALAEEQAAAAGHSLAAELQLLTVHGVLHLLGHDHAEPAEKATMWAAQTAVLRQLNLDIILGEW